MFSYKIVSPVSRTHSVAAHPTHWTQADQSRPLFKQTDSSVESSSSWTTHQVSAHWSVLSNGIGIILSAIIYRLTAQKVHHHNVRVKCVQICYPNSFHFPLYMEVDSVNGSIVWTAIYLSLSFLGLRIRNLTETGLNPDSGERGGACLASDWAEAVVHNHTRMTWAFTLTRHINYSILSSLKHDLQKYIHVWNWL